MENNYQINGIQIFRFQQFMLNFVAEKLHQNGALWKRLSKYPYYLRSNYENKEWKSPNALNVPWTRNGKSGFHKKIVDKAKWSNKINRMICSTAEAQPVEKYTLLPQDGRLSLTAV